MKIAYITAGAAGMYCGTCMHDNALAATLIQRGHEVALTPVYTPLRTDEQSVTIDRVFFGAINVYLQQKLSLFRHTPWAFDKLLDRPRLLQWVSRFSASTNATELGELTLSMAEGEKGHQAKELDKLVRWLQSDYRPDLVQLSHSLFLGFAHEIRLRLNCPVVCALQGEDLFFDELTDGYRLRVLDALRQRVGDVDLFTAPCEFYARKMSQALEIDPAVIRVTRLGVEAHDFGERPSDEHAGPVVIGYLARICPEKGFGLLLEAFHELAQMPGMSEVRLRAAGFVSGRDQAFLSEQRRRLESWGLTDRVDIVGEVDRRGKIDFLDSLDIFALPTIYSEPKGLPALEAMASGLPVVVPRHGAFPELVAATAGLLVEPKSPRALARALHDLALDPERRRQLGRRGREGIHRHYTHETMTDQVLAVYHEALGTASDKAANLHRSAVAGHRCSATVDPPTTIE